MPEAVIHKSATDTPPVVLASTGAIRSSDNRVPIGLDKPVRIEEADA
jgi:hypothetical protein